MKHMQIFFLYVASTVIAYGLMQRLYCVRDTLMPYKNALLKADQGKDDQFLQISKYSN